MPKVIPAEVTTRMLAPDEDGDSERQGQLYQPVQQLDKFPPPFKIKYEWFDPEKARQWLKKADDAPGFNQRKISLSEIRRWKNLHVTQRFVHFLPNQAICVDDDGVMLNGQHRLSGVAGSPGGTQAGFMVIYGVPRWMFAFFDTNKTRSLKDVFHIGARPSEPQTGSAMKLAMRYEEFLIGRRRPTGWRHWNLVKDEHQDVDAFYARREEVQDWYGVGDKTYRTARLLVPSVMVFRFYQSLAWPDGDEQIQDFTEKLATGKGLISPEDPTRLLREWARDAYINRDHIFAKRETHLMLLFRTFAHAQHSTRLPKLQWAYGQPMSMPFHPKGHEVAVKNVRLALDEIDREHQAG